MFDTTQKCQKCGCHNDKCGNQPDMAQYPEQDRNYNAWRSYGSAEEFRNFFEKMERGSDYELAEALGGGLCFFHSIG